MPQPVPREVNLLRQQHNPSGRHSLTATFDLSSYVPSIAEAVRQLYPTDTTETKLYHQFHLGDPPDMSHFMGSSNLVPRPCHIPASLALATPRHAICSLYHIPPRQSLPGGASFAAVHKRH